MYRVFILGDSVIAGRGVTKSQSWPILLSDYLFNDNQESFVYELGINGESSKGLLVRLRHEISSRVNKIRPDENLIIILGIGLNDSKEATSTLDIKKLIDNFSDNLKELLKICQYFSTKIIFVGPNPVSDSRMKELKIPLLNHFILEYSKAIEAVCILEKVSFINVFDIWPKKDYLRCLSDDGMHPNHFGHSNIYKIIAENITK